MKRAQAITETNARIPAASQRVAQPQRVARAP